MQIAKNVGLLFMKYDKMDLSWKVMIENAINYIELNLENKLNYSIIAAQAYSSEYHFQRMFAYITGFTLGEYIRNRRLTLAATDILNGEKIIDVALKYDYDSPDSFAKAFKIFHGFLPSEIKGGKINIMEFPVLKLPQLQKTTTGIVFKIKEIKEYNLIGIKSKFYGSPFGEKREKQERNFITTTRARQWLLRGASSNIETDFHLALHFLPSFTMPCIPLAVNAGYSGLKSLPPTNREPIVHIYQKVAKQAGRILTKGRR